MMEFVLLFRKSQKQLSEAEQRRAVDKGRTWGSQLLNEGCKLDVRQLGKESHRIDPDGESGKSGVSEWPIIAAVFLQASDFTEAVKIAKTHPGIHYGLSVEVRPWAPPPAWPPTPAQ